MVESGIGGDDVPGALIFKTNGGATSTTERLSIGSGGNVLIGNRSDVSTSDIGRLAIDCHGRDAGANLDNAAQYGLVFCNDPGANVSNGIGFFNHLGTSCGGAILHQDKGGDNIGDLVFYTSATADTPLERLRIDSGGKVMINTTNNALGSVTANLNIANDNTNGHTVINCSRNTTAERNQIRFLNPNGNVGSVVTSGTSTTFNTSSDYRLKENEVSISDGITRLKQLKPSRFNFIVKKDLTQDGFLAHEVQSVVPEAISGEKDAVKEDGSIDPQAIDLGRLVPLLVAAVQELIGKVEALEAA